MKAQWLPTSPPNFKPSPIPKSKRNKKRDFSSHFVQWSNLSPWCSESGPLFGRSNLPQVSLSVGTVRGKAGIWKEQSHNLGPAFRKPDKKLRVRMGDGGDLGGVLTPLRSLLQLEYNFNISLSNITHYYLHWLDCPDNCWSLLHPHLHPVAT